MKLFIADTLTTELENELDRCEVHSSTVEDNVTSDPISIDDVQRVEILQNSIGSVEESLSESNNEIPAPISGKEEIKTEEKSIKKKEKRCGEYLWILLTRLILSKSLSFDMKVLFLFRL